MGKPKIDLVLEPAEFFMKQVTSAMARQNLNASKTAEFYLVELLNRFIHSSNLYSENGGEQEPLAIMFLKSQSKDVEGGEKVRLLKRTGDISLYISGFFADSLNRKVVDLDYYRSMGAIAYRTLSGAIREDCFQELYTELHNKFSAFADVLTEISQDIFSKDNQNLLRLYEVYARTGSEVIRKQLVERGLVAPAVTSPSGKLKN
ncbi:MAG: hypothetical protein IT289_03255 [Oligoflexia bacterium]|nr:hypothetical protein [Oligoflexia bacterium]